jgi:phosphate transport system substrate-binding protein
MEFPDGNLRLAWRRIALCCCALLLFPTLASCKSQPESTLSPAAATLAAPGIGAKNYPRVDGSSSTFPLAQLLLARSLGLSAELRRHPPLEYAATESTLSLTFPLMSAPARLQEYSRLQRANSHRGTHESYEAMARGEADLLLVARAPSEDEIKTATLKKIRFEARPIARDALIFLVNKANPVRALTLAQLRSIYEGKTTSWKSVGGRDEAIRAYTRDRNSGSEELMRALLMKDRKVIEGGDRVISSMMGLLDAVTRNPRALGYSIFYYENVMNPREANVPLAVDGVLPTRETIADNTYPLVAPVYVVTRSDLKSDAPAALLRDWLLSGDGQKLVAQSGYVPLS